MTDRDSGSMHGEDFIDAADRTLEATYEEPMSLSEYVDLVLDHPGIASHATKYLLDAIEAAGTRTVIEEGEEKERYRFFDDPENDGEHAILGNTEVLNRLVDDLRSIATRRGKDEKIVWLDGPTATGKSELKRCLINGLREHLRCRGLQQRDDLRRGGHRGRGRLVRESGAVPPADGVPA